jgi:hypothetical protein
VVLPTWAKTWNPFPGGGGGHGTRAIARNDKVIMEIAAGREDQSPKQEKCLMILKKYCPHRAEFRLALNEVNDFYQFSQSFRPH